MIPTVAFIAVIALGFIAVINSGNSECRYPNNLSSKQRYLYTGIILLSTAILITVVCNVDLNSDYDNWRECILNSDGSDTACNTCDVLYDGYNFSM